MGVYPDDKKLALHILVSEISVCASIQFAGSWMMNDGLCVVVACANHMQPASFCHICNRGAFSLDEQK